MTTDSVGPARGWIRLGALGFAALAAVAVLLVAIAGRDRGDDHGGATLRPMAASESMSDEQAYAVAANTVRVWMRERNARQLANVEALSCPEPRAGVLATEIDQIKSGGFLRPLPVDAVARFTRSGPVWTVDVFRADGGASMFTLQVRHGDLLVCQIGSAPVP
ncbi:hypothetical protein [Mycobacterium asiaticum]|uniref:hypothetical protein n=1 Tax=Mycobacterium asiaticum TaxID=1790 RepID=UPI0012DB78DB|nr:hypothetical protein [Mycobacterium asiaticum]